MSALLAGWWAAIWPNLAASVIWASPALWGLHRKLDRHHAEHMAAIREGHGNGDR